LGVKSRDEVLSDLGHFLNPSSAKHSSIVGLQLATGRRIFPIYPGAKIFFENFSSKN
jgi:hypothetical protein